MVAKAVQLTGLFPLLGTAGTQLLLVTSALIVGVLTNILLERPLHSFVLRYGGRLLDIARSTARAGPWIRDLDAGRQTAKGSGCEFSPTIGAATDVPVLEPLRGDRKAW